MLSPSAVHLRTGKVSVIVKAQIHHPFNSACGCHLFQSSLSTTAQPVRQTPD